MEENLTPSESNIQMSVEHCIQAVRTTGKWMKFLAIIMIISIVFMVLGGIMAFVASGVIAQANPSMAALPGWCLGIIYLVAAAIYVIPTVYLMRASHAASSLATTNSQVDLNDFLKNNKSYWKFNGILTIIALGLCLLIIPIAVVAAIAAL